MAWHRAKRDTPPEAVHAYILAELSLADCGYKVGNEENGKCGSIGVRVPLVPLTDDTDNQTMGKVGALRTSPSTRLGRPCCH